MINDRIGKVASPYFYGQLLDVRVGADPNGEKVFNEKFNIHGNIALVELVVSLGYDSFLVEAVS